jgi:hypothetical protein
LGDLACKEEGDTRGNISKPAINQMLCFFEEIGGVLPPTRYIYKKIKGARVTMKNQETKKKRRR